jgi:hypothetical protein
MFYSAAWYWGNRLRFGLILTAAVTLSLSPLAWAEPIRELRDCATCPALIEVPAGTFERLDRLGGPTFSPMAAPGIATGVSSPAPARP